MTTDKNELNYALDRTMADMFIGKSAAFLSSLMCDLEFIWDEQSPTAYVSLQVFGINPVFFMGLPRDTRKTVFAHELWHLARLHLLRTGNRDKRIWNQACDIRINNDLEKEGYSFVGVEWCWKDQSFGDMPEEDIYDILIKDSQKQMGGNSWDRNAPSDDGDLSQGQGQQPTAGQIQSAVNNVVRAMHQAKQHNQAGSIPGNVSELIKNFLSPVVPWQTLLQRFFTEALNEDYTWKRPNRRHQDIYLPSRFQENGRLEHLMYFLDVSDSISTQDITRFNSEVKHVKSTYMPEKMTLVQFDTKIQKIDVIKESDQFNSLQVVGRGGTSLSPVRKMIEKEKPTAAIIFSDMYCEPMQKPTKDIPIIWVVVNNTHVKIPYGKVINIKE